MRILVTGASGFIGSHTVEALLNAGHDTWGIDNLRTGRLKNLDVAATNPRFRFEEGDVVDSVKLSALVESVRPQAIIHLAGLVSVRESIIQPELNYTLNVHTAHIVVSVARQWNVRRIVFASSAAVYGDVQSMPIQEAVPKSPLSPYGWAKLAAESVLFGAASGADFGVWALRYFNVYGPRQDPASPYSGVLSIFSRLLLSGEPLVLHGTGEQTRDFLHVRDVANANLLAATSESTNSGALNICTGRAVSLSNIIAMLREIDSSLCVQEAPAQSADIPHSRGAPDAALRELGFSTKIALEDGLTEYVKSGAALV